MVLLMHKCIALLDPPSNESYAMVPIVVEDQEGELWILGSNGPLLRRFSKWQYEELLNDYGAAMPLDEAQDLPEIDQKLVAYWIGDEFLRKSEALNAPELMMPDTGQGRVAAQGRAWFLPPEQAHSELSRWSELAAKQAIAEKNLGIAWLVSWCLPQSIAALGSLWYCASDDTKRQRTLELAGQYFHMSDLKEVEAKLSDFVDSCK